MQRGNKMHRVITDRFSVYGHFSFSLHATPLVFVLFKTEPDACVDERRYLPAIFAFRQIRRVLHSTQRI